MSCSWSDEMKTVDGFLPSTHGFRFRNAWPKGTPAIVIDAGVRTIRLGDANSGLCGGMALAAADLYAAGRAPVPWTTPPAGGTVAFRYLSRRLLDSWNVPTGLATFAYWAATPDDDSLFGLRPGVRRMTIRHELPRVRRRIDAGRLVLLGLVTVRSTAPSELARCHIVLAYGWAREGASMTLAVYDPNSPRRDDVTIVIDTTDLDGSTAIQHDVRIRRPIRGVFVLPYQVHDPGPVAA